MFREWIRRIYATRDDEIDCEKMFDLLPGYVDLEVSGGDAVARWPQVKYHLSQCPDCEDLYQTLLEVATLEAHGTLPDPADVLEEMALPEQQENSPEPTEQGERVFAG